MKEKKLISVVIPVYKVEKYLKRCIDSVINQTYEKLEIILIDDGSPDNCGNICDYYSKIDDRIIVHHQKNSGVSGARNKGIELAQGDYIGFVDPDDYIEPKLFEELYYVIEKSSADISICGFKTFGDEKKNHELCNKIWTKDEALENLLLNKIITSHLWNKLFKKELFNGIEFDLGKRYEDVRIIHKLFSRAIKVVSIKDSLYNYYIRKDSITGATKHSNSQEFIDSLDSRCNDLIDTKELAFAKIGEFNSIRRIIYEMVIYKDIDMNFYKKMLNKEKNLYLEGKIKMNLSNRILAIFFLLTPKSYSYTRLLADKLFGK
ncbi:glycosyltransferase family 2 protein [Clostridium perfringens]|uniref:glycosyltransferase family 2 protein n=1 Tax=Clostridium perfringens TaxID=1502 RepID=UPI003513B4EF